MSNSALEEDTDDGADQTIDDEGATLTGGPAPAPVSFTRGMNTRAAVAWVRGNHGDDGVAALARSLPQEVLDDLGGASLRPSAMAWVPFRAHARLLEHIDTLFGAPGREVLVDVGRSMAVRDFPALARPIASLLSPGFFLDMATRIWGLYNTHGNWEMSRGDRELIAVLVGRPEYHPAFCVGMRGWIEGALLFCGATEACAHEERCGAKGAPCCSLRITWKEKRDTARDRRPRPPT